jgi:hypothetical protein
MKTCVAVLALLAAACRGLGPPADPIFDPGTATEVRALEPAEFDALIERAHAFLAQRTDYAATLEARERLDGQLVAKLLDLKAEVDPFRVALAIQLPPKDAGRAVYWDETWNDGDLAVVVPGMVGSLLGRLNLDPTGSLAMNGQRHPVTDIGIPRLLAQIESRWGEVRALDARVEAGSTTLDERPAQLVGFLVPTKREGVQELHRIGFDVEWSIPVYYALEEREANGERVLLEEYLYRSLRWDQGFTEADFRPPDE